MSTKRTPVVLVIVAVIASVVFPVRVAAQGGRTSPVAPRREVVAAVIQEAYDKFKDDNNGKNADYIPILRR
jgi:glutaminase